jgi:hypothetical protein
MPLAARGSSTTPSRFPLSRSARTPTRLSCLRPAACSRATARRATPTYGSGSTPAIASGWVQVASGVAIWQQQHLDQAGSLKLGGHWFALIFSSGSLDQGSPAQFEGDGFLTIIASNNTQG